MTSQVVVAIGYVLVLAVVNLQVVEYLKAPVAVQFPKLSLWWMRYLSFSTGTALAYGFGLDAFAFMPPHPEWLGMLLTGCLIGGGASLLFDITKSIAEWAGKLAGVLADLVSIIAEIRGLLGPGDLEARYTLTDTGRDLLAELRKAADPDTGDYLVRGDRTESVSATPYGKEFAYYESLPDPERKA